ncbi:hypothetical protein [Paractinoplanes durhamensis]|uniref:hypothetical protein n=1 Tax=Paractinoplanes durhamensis TaxID=113563 RepID=UPI001EF3075F|nr:hypothetical protein [Actinoplanes durhamensis]
MLSTLPGLLYRISTAPGSGLVPRVTGADGRLVASLLPPKAAAGEAAGGDGPDEVRIVLNRDVRWHLSLPAGAGEQQLDLRRGRISRLDLGASGLVELRLPAPDTAVPITLSGGIGSMVVTAEAGTALRVQLDRGAGFAETPWSGGAPAPPGTVWPTTARPARRGYLIRARSAIGNFSLRTRQKAQKE